MLALLVFVIVFIFVYVFVSVEKLARIAWSSLVWLYPIIIERFRAVWNTQT